MLLPASNILGPCDVSRENSLLAQNSYQEIVLYNIPGFFWEVNKRGTHLCFDRVFLMEMEF